MLNASFRPYGNLDLSQDYQNNMKNVWILHATLLISDFVHASFSSPENR